MAKKILKNRTQITSTLKNELNDELKSLSEQTDIPISKLLDQAVELLIDEKRGVQRTPQSNKNIRNIVLKDEYKYLNEGKSSE